MLRALILGKIYPTLRASKKYGMEMLMRGLA